MRIFFLFAALPLYLSAQPVDSIDAPLLQRHLSFLASDSLKGRGNYTQELQQAAFYIAEEFSKAGLAALPGFEGYFHPFTTKAIAPHQWLPDSPGRYDPQQVLLNVVAVLPGRTKPAEVVLFSAHYDHIGEESHGGGGIHNGANDNASGTAAVLALAQYYAKRRDNDRTLIFCAFAGEELGLLGSYELVGLLNLNTIKAMINIEMIGRHGYSGKNAFFITGAQHSSLQSIFKKNLKGKKFRLLMEPDSEKHLFERSDNHPFATRGVAAHSIMASDDDDPCYHRSCDDLARIDIPNMVRLIEAIITGTSTIISGQDTPEVRKW